MHCNQIVWIVECVPIEDPFQQIYVMNLYLRYNTVQYSTATTPWIDL